MGSVSVIIPCYRQAHLLPDAIQSVLSQTYGNAEVVVVDDGSPDDTARVAAQYPVRYVRQANQGLAAARNAGIRASRGDYLVFLDADDRLLPHHLQTSLLAFETFPHVSLVCGDFCMVGTDHTWNHVHRCDPSPDHFASLLRINFVGAFHSVMARRTAVARAGGFRPELKAAEDYDLLLRIVRREPMYCHHQVVAEYRRYGPQMSQRWDLMLRWQITALRTQRKHIHGHPIYEQAYQDGIERCRRYYGECAVWRMVSLLRAKQYREAAGYAAVLVRFYPSGLSQLLQQKLARQLMRRQVPHA